MKKIKLIYHITAEIKGIRVNLFYKSIKQAKYHNPIAINFQNKGVCMELKNMP